VGHHENGERCALHEADEGGIGINAFDCGKDPGRILT
jgi:hypothetical protein